MSDATTEANVDAPIEGFWPVGAPKPEYSTVIHTTDDFSNSDKEFKFDDYGIFTEAINTANNLKYKVDTAKNDLNVCKANLGDENVFMGPISDSAQDGFTKVDSKVTTFSENMNTITDYLVETADRYNKGDTSASKIIGMQDGKIVAGAPGSFTTNVGATKGIKSGNENQDYVHDYLADQGYNEAAICGILANIRKETNFKSDIGGDDGTSYGMCGWHATRWDRLKDYCRDNNLDISTIETQSQFLVWELNTFDKYIELNNFLKNVPNTAQGAYDAAYQFCITYERPRDYYDKGEQRGGIAMDEYFPFYTSGGNTQ